MSAGTTVIDDKLNKYRSIEVEISELFAKKQSTLSQFNENTLVKGVSLGSMFFQRAGSY